MGKSGDDDTFVVIDGCRWCPHSARVQPWDEELGCSYCDALMNETPHPRVGRVVFAVRVHENACPVEGCGDERPHYHREDVDWGDYKVFTSPGAYSTVTEADD